MYCVDEIVVFGSRSFCSLVASLDCLCLSLLQLFDIAKPPPVGWADRHGKGRGAMVDDLIAGAMASVLIVVALRLV